MNENPERDSQQPVSDDNELDDEDLLAHHELDFEDEPPGAAVEAAAPSVPPVTAKSAAGETEVVPDVEAEELSLPEPVLALVENDDAGYQAPAVLPPSRLRREAAQAAPPAATPVARRSVPAFEPSTRAEGSGQVPVFTVFRPGSNTGTLVGAGAVVFCLAAGLALIYKSFSYDPSLSQLWPLLVGSTLLLLSALGAYWTWGSISLSYVVDRNSLSIRWGAQRQIVPLVNIERLIPAAPDGEEPDIQGVDWPGHHIGRARVPQLGEVLFYSGHRAMSDVLYIQTASQSYAISVPDPVSFAEAVQANQMRGPLFEQRQIVHREGISAQSFWMDPQARFLTAVLLGAFVLVLAYVLQTYPGLAQSVPLRFPALGAVIRVTDKSELLDIPRSAAAFLGLNLILAVVLHPWERMVSIVLLLAGIAIQLALLVAAIVAVA